MRFLCRCMPYINCLCNFKTCPIYPSTLQPLSKGFKARLQSRIQGYFTRLTLFLVYVLVVSLLLQFQVPHLPLPSGWWNYIHSTTGCTRYLQGSTSLSDGLWHSTKCNLEFCCCHLQQLCVRSPYSRPCIFSCFQLDFALWRCVRLDLESTPLLGVGGSERNRRLLQSFGSSSSLDDKHTPKPPCVVLQYEYLCWPVSMDWMQTCNSGCFLKSINFVFTNTGTIYPCTDRWQVTGSSSVSMARELIAIMDARLWWKWH